MSAEHGSFPLGVMNSTLPHLLPAEFAAAAAEAGYDFVSLRIATSQAGEPFRLLPGSPELAQTKQVLAEAGLPVMDLEFVTFTAKTRPDHWLWMVETTVELGASYLNAGCKHGDLELFAEQAAALDAAAGEAGIHVLLEPIKFYSALDYAELAELASTLPNTGILLDALQLYRFAVQTPADGVEDVQFRALETAGDVADQSGVFQLCDIGQVHPEGTDAAERLAFYEHEARFARVLPGTGFAELSKIAALLPAGTPISIESPHTELAERMGDVSYLRELRRRALQILP